MRLTRRIRIQLAIFAAVAVVAGAVMSFEYIRLPSLLFGVGRYTVTVQLPTTGGLYPRGNVTYRGVGVGRVSDVRLTDTGIEAVLSLRSGVSIPSDLRAEVHSQSAVGEQYVLLLPQSEDAPPLKNGDVIPESRASVPPDISTLLDDTNRGLQAIPQENLRTVVDESYTAVGGLGPDLARLVRGSTALAIDARKNLDSITALVDGAAPVLDSQADTADSIDAWAANLADVSGQFGSNDEAFRGVLQKGAPAAEEVRHLLDRFQPSLPIALANLVGIGNLALNYKPALEQLLVLVPEGASWGVALSVPNANTNLAYRGLWSTFNLNLNLPPPCATGYLPASQQRPPAAQDAPERTPDDLYCRVPQDSPFNVRGVRNTPCMLVPGKRAPTAKMCNSDEEYVPLNEGFNWKGDPNATLSGQDVPQKRPDVPPSTSSPYPPRPPVTVVPYDPVTGSYTAPDGRVYTQADLAPRTGDQSWQDLLVPPAGG
ncbi:MlaD family protein [Mycolicibacterium elephantis]|uniref:MCE family protein n=1 Tax=Mycolicibacterium elephantis TaxID=81858 RepID=UPI0007EBE9BD|nr:MlaD family protein [Mycolicibacterium elephantis]OBB16359.1 mammalian cell entry protein [Mycolicibacterium elephantis]OBE95303.1 mammalian cell entry protein [Mycolicibacterium elephantis]